MSERERIAEVLYEHDSDGDCNCGCGWQAERAETDLTEYTLHVADALIAAGVTMPAPKQCPAWASRNYRCTLDAGHTGDHSL